MRKAACFLLLVSCYLFTVSCSMQKQVAKRASQDILDNPDFVSAHIGISLYDPSSNKYLYDHQGDKFFVPASNTKILTCYAAMKHLGDSLLGLRYSYRSDGAVTIEPTGDPTFLHPDFKKQPVLDFLKKSKQISFLNNHTEYFQPWGRGWAWDDYASDYMVERSIMPMYGNTARFFLQHDTVAVLPGYFYPVSNLKQLNKGSSRERHMIGFSRAQADNLFSGAWGAVRTAPFPDQLVPFKIRTAVTKEPAYIALLEDTLHTELGRSASVDGRVRYENSIHSQPTDSMLSIMMHRSDNFFAEQSLLMVSFAKLGYMDDRRIIDTLLKTDYAGMPQKPKWVDGSGLSRYNLVSPQDFVWVLAQMKNEFSWERIRAIFPTGGEGTLSSYYKNHSGRIYAKTGSLSNHLALSGFITTKKGKQLIFSVLVNAEMAPAANIRKGVEKFLTGIMDRY